MAGLTHSTALKPIFCLYRQGSRAALVITFLLGNGIEVEPKGMGRALVLTGKERPEDVFLARRPAHPHTSVPCSRIHIASKSDSSGSDFPCPLGHSTPTSPGPQQFFGLVKFSAKIFCHSKPSGFRVSKDLPGPGCSPRYRVQASLLASGRIAGSSTR